MIESVVDFSQRNAACDLCAIAASCKTRCLWGEGPKDARVVIVGQNPGGQEDFEGRPFIGPSGKLLNQLLQEAGLDRDTDVYITNAVKCLTPSNREPTQAERKRCKPYLDAELAQLNPKVIVVLGNTALAAVTGKGGITKARGMFHERNGVPVVAAYHPAYALRSPQYVADLRADILRAATFVNPIPQQAIEWEYGNDERDPHDYEARIWSFDIETNGKELTDPSLEVLMLGIDDGRTRIVYAGRHIRLGYERLCRAVHTHGVRIWGHNSIGFDSEVLYQKFGWYAMSDDTMILSHCLDENAPLGLEAQCCTNLGVRPWKKQVTWDWGKMSADDLRLAASYNAEDIANTMLLTRNHIRKAQDLGVDRVYDIVKKATTVFEHHVNRNGIAIDLPRLITLKEQLQTEALDAALKFEQIVGHSVNMNSPAQVGEALFKQLGLQPVRYTDGGQPSTDEESIKRLLLVEGNVPPEFDDKGATALRALHKSRKSGKLASMLEAYQTKTSADGRLYFNTYTWRTTTGRTTADQGFQQWPHDKRVRSLLTAPPGFKLIEADYSQLQMRLAAEISGSAAMQTIFREGIDPHTFMASRMMNKPMEAVTSEERYPAKPVNFGLLFGGDIYTLRTQALKEYDVVFSEADAQRFHDIFHETYQLEPWYARVAGELRANGSVRSPLGAIRHLPNIYAGDPKMRLEALRQAINFPVQNFEVMIAFVALWECYRQGLRIVAFLHDALYVECPQAQAEHISRVLREIMVAQVPEILSSKYDLRLAIPLDVEIKIK